LEGFNEKNLSGSSQILADETTPGEVLENRLERYAKAKKRSESVLRYIIHLIDNYPQAEKPDFNRSEYRELQRISRQLKECGAFLIFRHYFTAGQHRLIGGCTCKRHLLCMLCAVRRAARQLQSYLRKVEQVLSENSNQKLVLITLTVKNGDDLQERYKHLTQSLRVLTNRRKVLRSISTVFTEIQGAVWTFEATNKGNGWHPHCHMMAIVEKDLDIKSFQESLSREWKEVSKDSFIVDVRMINETNEKDRIGAFCEVFKYALKTNDMSVENQYQAHKKLRGKRLIASLGSLYNVQVSESLNDEVEDDLELLPYVDILFRYSEYLGYQEIETMPQVSPVEQHQYGRRSADVA